MERTKEQRKKRIVEILSLLHEGGTFEEAKRLFNEEFDGVDVTEITSAEKSLIQGGLKAEEIQKLCNIHVSVFKGSINEIHKSEEAYGQAGHPVHTLQLENQVLQSLITDEIDDLMEKIKKGDWQKKDRLVAAIEDLKQVNKHYVRKETLFFSYMEKYGITAPPQVMWGVDDEIRKQIKDLLDYVKNPRAAFNPLLEKWEAAKHEIEEMIFKEEEIMIPMTLDVFSLKDWENIAEDSYDIGFAYIPEPPFWKAGPSDFAKEKEQEEQRQMNIQQAKETTDGIAEELANAKTQLEKEEYDWQNVETADTVVLPTGILKLDQLLAIFDVLPVDLTFVDHTDRVRFFSEGKHRIFPRTKSIIGREVVNCHPPKSMHMVEKILADFHSGANDTADFWIDINERKIYIRYFALKNQENQYLGCLEVTQDITDIQKISGQNRLLEGFTKD
ncbi:DUF438 domain-containing protein [Tetragenococcus solitarius]|uniref:DUF438 domain-containing protein n=1 Tax=Tetragenococcus solitarius TaxID=71453 RepID=A0ABP6KPA0_9ENTE|nr:DUF438 domain-containing protein [Tetragenococcus solitarius]